MMRIGGSRRRAKPAAHGWRRAVRIILVTLALCPAAVIVLVSGVILYARTGAGREVVRQLALEHLRPIVPGLAITHVGGDYVHTLELDDVAVWDSDGRRAVHADRIALRYDLLSLLRRVVAVGELRIESPSVIARPDPRGGLNLDRLVVTSGPGGGAGAPPSAHDGDARGRRPPRAWHLRLDRLVVTGGSADFLALNGDPYSLEGVTVNASAEVEEGRIAAVVRALEVSAARGAQRYHASVAASARISGDRVDVQLPHLVVSGVADDHDIVAHGSAVGPRHRIVLSLEVGARGAGKLTAGGEIALPRATTPARAGVLARYNLRLEAHAVDPAAFDAGLPSGAIDARIDARGGGLPFQADSHAQLTAWVAPSRVGGVALHGVQLRANSSGQTFRAELRASAGARAHGRGHGQGSDQVLLLPAGVAGSGGVELRVAGTFPEELRVDGSAHADRLQLGDLRLGQLQIGVQGQRSRGTDRLALRGHIEGLASKAITVASARFDGALGAVETAHAHRLPSGHVTVNARRVRAAGAPVIDALALTATSDGARLGVHATARGPKLDAALDAHGAGSARAADVTLDRLSVRFQTARYAQSIALQKPVQLSWRDGDRIQIGPTLVHGAGYQLTGDVALEGFYRLRPPRAEAGTPGRSTPMGQITASLQRASLRGFDAIDAKLQATLNSDRAAASLDASQASARVHADASVPVVFARSGPPRLARRGAIAVHVKTNAVQMAALPLLQKQLARRGVVGGVLSLDAAVEGDIADPQARADLQVKDVTIRKSIGTGRQSRLRTIPGVGLALRLETKPRQILLTAHAMLRNSGAVNVDARSDADVGDLLRGGDLGGMRFNARVDIPSLDVGPYIELLTGTSGIAGVLVGHMVVDGTPRRPQGTADLVLSNINIDLAPVGAVRVHATADPDQVKGKLTVDDHGGGQLAVEGDLSLAAGRAYHATARTAGLNLQVVRLVVPTLREIDGQLQASLELTGSAGGGGGAAAAPQLHGTASITHGRLGLAGQPTFHDIEAAIAVHPDKIELTRIAARSGDGRLDGKGWVTLERLHPTSLTLTAQARSFRIAAAGSSSARLDGDFAVEGALRASVLAGTVSIPKATLWLPKLSTSSGNSNLQSLTDHTDVRFVDAAADAARERAARQAAGQGQPPLRLDVHAHAGTIHVRGKDLDIELESDLQVATGTEGAAKGKPLLTGSIRVRRGRISINGQRFDIDEGTATFDGSPEINPALTIRLTRQFPEAQVIVQISGTPKSPRLQMTSDPPIYDQGQIFSLILTGQAGGAPSAGRGPDPTSAITSMVLGRIADQIAPQLGLDVLRVENVDLMSAQGQPLGGTDTRVEVGKYVSDRIYVSYAHVFGANETQNTNEARMEYRITTRWMIETIFGDAGVGSVDAVWTRRY